MKPVRFNDETISPDGNHPIYQLLECACITLVHMLPIVTPSMRLALS